MKKWLIEFFDDFVLEFEGIADDIQDELLAQLKVLEQFGPALGRPHVDTLNDSKHANMKELRFNAGNGVWRVAFAFDPERNAVVLVGGDKSGGSEKRFYKRLIKRADERFDRHLASVKQEKTNG